MSSLTATQTAAAVVLKRENTIVLRDFPRWLPPMLVKELRQGLRTRGFVGTLVGFQVLMLIVTLIALSSQQGAAAGVRAASAAASGFFWMMVAVPLIIVTPSRALGGLQGEVEAKTIDLLMLTRLTAWRVILGKWISLLVQATLLLIATLPYLVVRYFTHNADLVSDLEVCGGLLGICGLLTAAGLWGSGIARLARVLMGIALLLLMGNVIGVLGAIFGGRAFGSRSPFGNAFDMPMDLLNAALVTAFFLVSAVRNIAPPAENHSAFARLLPLLALIAAAVAELVGGHSLAVRQLYISSGLLGFVMVFELASPRVPMATHWRHWHSRGPLLRCLGRMVMPGWSSAFVFGMLIATAWIGAALLLVSMGGAATARADARHVAWVATLAFCGIVFPAVVLSFVRQPFPRVPAYFFILMLFTLLSGLALALAESRGKFTGLRTVMEVAPFSSFLFSLNRPPASPGLLVSQAASAAAVILAGVWQTRYFWRELTRFEARDREAMNSVAPA